jgi:DNA polymerase elongation subunit (family B)
MIVNYEYKYGKLMLSYIDKKGDIKFKNYDWKNPEEWVYCDNNDKDKSDKYKTWDKRPVKKKVVKYPNRYTIYEYLYNLPKEDFDDIFAYNEPKLFFCDIEVEITEGFPEAHLADNKVTALCFVHNDKILLLGIKELTDEQISKMEKDINKHFIKQKTKYTLEWHFCKSEYDMLSLFFNRIIKNIPTLTGWNFVDYDWVYLVTRARKLGIDPAQASPSGNLVKPWRSNESEYKPIYEELPKHRLIFDYMKIFDKWDNSIKIKESISLDFVSNALLGTKKLEYDGNLKLLYTENYYDYMLYNCIDTALVQLIHKKVRTFDIMLAISNLARIPIEDSLSAIRVTEGIFFKKYLDSGIVMVKNKYQTDTTVEIENSTSDMDVDMEVSGGYVKYPKVGLKKWISVFDFASLYPTIMIQFNISPESFCGIKINDTDALLNGNIYKIQENDIVLLNGAVFKNEDSQTKLILQSIFKNRRQNKYQGLDYKKQSQLVRNYLNSRIEN